MPAAPATALRHSLRSCLCRMALDNPGNNCFANSGFVAALWAMLNSSAWNLTHWGQRSSELQQLLALANPTCNLANCPWFITLMSHWHGSSGQGDPTEFTAHLLDGLGFHGFNFTWEQRVQIGATVECNDSGRQIMPLTFQLDPDLLEDDSIQLRHLVPSWVNQHGMHRALCQHTPLVCVHIDRYVQSATGSIHKSVIPVRFRGAVEFPFWTSQDMDIEWIDFQWVAAIAHLGTDNSGHVRTLLKVEPDTRDFDNPVRALLTEDGVSPERIDQIPVWFQQNVCCVWFCACSHIELHQLPMQPGAIPFAHRPYTREAAGVPAEAPPDLLQMFRE